MEYLEVVMSRGLWKGLVRLTNCLVRHGETRNLVEARILFKLARPRFNLDTANCDQAGVSLARTEACYLEREFLRARDHFARKFDCNSPT